MPRESQLNKCDIHGDDRKRLTPAACGSDITRARRAYVENFIRSQGYIATRLDDARIMQVFALLSRLEELATDHKHNGHNWELCYAPLSRQRQAYIPVVDESLREWASEGLLSTAGTNTPLWPQGKRFALCLTHDIDHVSGDLAKERIRSLPSYRGAPGRERLVIGLSTARALARKSIWWKPAPDPPLDMWLAEEDRYGFRSSLFFLASPLPRPHWQDSFYSYDDRVAFEGHTIALREVMSAVASRGWDVGLHGASRSSADPDLLSTEKLLVERASGHPVLTTRQHHLYFDARYTPYYQELAGLKADSTLGSNISSGFRCGTCFPFFLYDLYTERQLDVLEAPLIVQDVALFNQLGMNEDLALSHCLDLMQTVASVNGVLTILWHNDLHKSNPRFSTYSRLLRAASELGAWGCSLRGLNDWWRDRLHRAGSAEGGMPAAARSQSL